MSSMRDDPIFRATQVVIVLALAIVIGFLIRDVNQCSNSGGKSVRGIFWVECLEIPNDKK